LNADDYRRSRNLGQAPKRPFVAPRPLNCKCGAFASHGFGWNAAKGQEGIWLCRPCAEDAGLLPPIPVRGSER
jgi:hypothetical protein